MADAPGLPAPAMGVLEALLAGMPPGTIAWVFQAFEDENAAATLRPGGVRLWDDARSRGKIAGQPVLYLQSHPRSPRWVGWGRIVAPGERWRVLGVSVRCEEVVREGLPVVAREVGADRRAGEGAHEWEFRELGEALGLGSHRERTPFLDNGARDLRLGAHDLAHLFRLQPGLARFGRRAGSTG